MSRKHKKCHDEGHMDETWLIPYSDLLTLLLALFIVLFSMSSVDAEKFKQMAESFNSEFNGGTGILEYPSPLPQEQQQSSNIEDARNKPNTEATHERKELEALQNKMNQYINSKNLNLEVKTTLTDEGLMLTILNDVIFESGSAEIRKEDYQMAKEISELLVMDEPREIVISGHTDNVPISNRIYSSNWELSIIRAVNFMEVILENEKLDPRLFSAKGYGEYKPIASNTTDEGRKANRRVEVLIRPYSVNDKQTTN